MKPGRPLKRARNVSIDLDTQRLSSLEYGTRRTGIQTSDSAPASANIRLNNLVPVRITGNFRRAVIAAAVDHQS